MLEVDTFENVMLDDSQLAGALVKSRLEPTDESTLKIITVTSNESGDTYNWEEISLPHTPMTTVTHRVKMKHISDLFHATYRILY